MLEGKIVTLSNDLSEEHAKAIAELANEYDIMRNIGSHGFPYPYTLQDALFFISKNRETYSKAFAIDFLILVDNEIVGVIGLSDIDYDDRSAHVGYWIGKKYWNKGYASEALKLMREFASDELSLRRLHTSVLEYNPASLKVLLKNGFAIEGYSKDAFYFEGKYYAFFKLGRVFP